MKCHAWIFNNASEFRKLTQINEGRIRAALCCLFKTIERKGVGNSCNSLLYLESTLTIAGLVKIALREGTKWLRASRAETYFFMNTIYKTQVEGYTPEVQALDSVFVSG